MYTGSRLWEALEAATALANSGPPVYRDERLADATQLEGFVERHDIAVPGPVTDADADAARELRDELREVFVAPSEQAAVARLNTLVDDARLRPQLTREGDRWEWHAIPPPDAPLVAHLTARVAVALLSLIAYDGLRRLHRCDADGCHGVYVDNTRNRSRRYCTPRLCGNRTNLAAFRARRRAEQQARE